MTDVTKNLICFSSDISVFEPFTPSSRTSPFLLSILLPQQKRFLRCSPFDDFNLWKSQVDNGSNKGGERLSILTKSLLLRRTKDQLDSTGKPLVITLPCVHGGGRTDGDRVLVLGRTAICSASRASEPSVFCCGGPGVAVPCVPCVTAILCSGEGGSCSPGWTGVPVSTLGLTLSCSVSLCNFIPAACLPFPFPRCRCPSADSGCTTYSFLKTKRLSTVSFSQGQGACHEEAPPHVFCFSVLAWPWVWFFRTVFMVSSIRGTSAFLVLHSPFSPFPLPGSPLFHLKAFEPALQWLPGTETPGAAAVCQSSGPLWPIGKLHFFDLLIGTLKKTAS